MFLENDNQNQIENKKECMVLKTNRLITAIEKLTLSETRLIQLAIVGAREYGGLYENQPLTVTAKSYAETFNTTIENAYKILLEAEERLFEQKFYYLDDGEKVKSRWVNEVKYKKGSPSLEITLSRSVINEIINIDGYERFFTTYRLSQTSDFTSIYSLRLFELLMMWSKAEKTPIYELQAFRKQLGIEDHEYQKMGNFKARVLDTAVNEINERTEVKVSYEQHKVKRKIVGFSFTIKPKNPNKFKRKKISIAEALELSQTVVKGGYAGESEKEAIGRVMNHKDENGRSVYFVKATKEDWIEHRANKKQLSDKVEEQAKEHKWNKIGNTLVDDDYIDKYKRDDESRIEAKKRIESELQEELNKVHDDDRPLTEILGIRK